MAIVILIFSSLHQTSMIYSECCVGQLFLFCLYLQVFILSMSQVFAQLKCACWGWGGSDGEVLKHRMGVGMIWHDARLPSLPSLLLPISEPIGWQSMAPQTCESISMPVQMLTKSGGLTVIRIDCLVLCLPIYIMDLSHSMMCFCQVLPH